MIAAEPTQRCGTCARYMLEWMPRDGDLEDAIGECAWDPGPVPFAWRYCLRERTSVTPLDGAGCQQWVVQPPYAPVENFGA